MAALPMRRERRLRYVAVSWAAHGQDATRPYMSTWSAEERKTMGVEKLIRGQGAAAAAQPTRPAVSLIIETVRQFDEAIGNPLIHHVVVHRAYLLPNLRLDIAAKACRF